jgi:hypothetical protein
MKIELSSNEIEQILDALSIAKNKYSCFKEIYDNFLQKIPKTIERRSETPTVKDEDSKNTVDGYIIYNKQGGTYLQNWEWSAVCCSYTLFSNPDPDQYWWTHSKHDAYVFRIRNEAKQFADAISLKYNIGRADIEVVRIGRQADKED